MNLKRLAKTGSGLLLAMYVFYFASVSLFIHTHVFAGGRITHSHPYFPVDKHHSHTQAQFDLIEWLDSAVPLAGCVAAVAAAVAVPLVIYRRPGCERVMLANRSLCLLRAPPAAIY